ncbi:MAG TPA: dihydroorotate dehydrogenase-like protein [Acidobacteriota bacterium]|nr:dihydroorotate dehydrogenase-like protein [Acidobacteriota bacterium]
MTDLTTSYMGLELKNPLVASASPLSESVDNYRRLEDAGVSAVVNYSLFEEEITHESYELHHYLTQGTESFAESLSYFPEPDYFKLGPEEYAKHIQRAVAAVDIPVIGSLNGHSLGGWTKYAQLIEEAGASALELNLYYLPTDPDVSGQVVEERYLEVVRRVRASVSIPLAVKLSPFFSAMAHMARRIDQAGADGLVLFNRFYQPDIDLEELEVRPNVLLSSSQSLRLPLRWIAILYGHVECSMAGTGGIHTAEDVLKMLMAGADVTMVCSALLRNGIDHVREVLSELVEWMQEREYESVRQMQGSLSQRACPDPAAFERANYMKALRTYRVN